MITHKTTVTINKPVSEVYKFVFTDYFQNHPKWDPRVVSLKVDTTGPVGKGTKGHEVRKQGGRNTDYAFEIVDFQPSRSMTFQAKGGPAQFSAVWAGKAVNDQFAPCCSRAASPLLVLDL